MRRLLALALLLTACAPSVRARRLAATPTYAPVAADSVRVFASANDVPTPFDVVGHLDTNSGPIVTSRGVLEKLRREAGLMGANAIVYRRKHEFGIGSSGERDILAIRYTNR